jgi:hypothetical protein
MNADDLIRPLKPAATGRRRGIVPPIVAGTVSGVLSGLAILFGAASDHGKPSPVPQPAPVESVQLTAAVLAPAPPTPPARTITLTVVDSQTGARREVVVPASTDDQSEESKPAPARSAVAAKSRRH